MLCVCKYVLVVKCDGVCVTRFFANDVKKANMIPL
jgi:hypothetical protein